MMKIIKTGILSGLIAFTIQGFASTGTTLEQASKQCEQDVIAACVQDLCPKYCEKVYEKKSNGPELVLQCKKECTTENRCKLNIRGGVNDPKNSDLNDQMRGQFLQCFKETRTAIMTKNGSQTGSWKSFETPAWSKLMKP